MGIKDIAKAEMIKANVPVVPGSEGLIQSIDDAKKLLKNWLSSYHQSHCRWWWKRYSGCS